MGECCSGKSCIAKQLVRKEFNTDNEATIIDSYTFDLDVEDKVINLKISDFGGMDGYALKFASDIKRSDSIIFVYAINEIGTFDKVQSLCSEAFALVDEDEIPFVVIVGNKIDLESDREVKKEDAEAFAKSFNAPLYEITAKDHMQVEHVFKEAVKGAINKKNAKLAKNKDEKKTCRIV